MGQGVSILLFLMGREPTWERKFLVLLRCLDALREDYRAAYGPEAVPESLVEEFGRLLRRRDGLFR